MSVSINPTAGAASYTPSVIGQPARDDASPCSPAEAIARAYSLLGEDAYKQYSEDLCRDLKSWQSERQAKVKAVYQSADEERSAANFRAIFKYVGAGLSVVAGAAQIGGACAAARFQNKGNRLQESARADLKRGKAMLAEATSSQERTAAHRMTTQARQELKDLSTDVSAQQVKGEKWRMFGDSGRAVDNAGNGVMQAVGESGGTAHDVRRKYADMSGQLNDGNSQLALEMSRRRAGDAGEARKRADEANQMLVDIARTNARNVIA